jgi:hypothetical protein
MAKAGKLTQADRKALEKLKAKRDQHKQSKAPHEARQKALGNRSIEK